jgi:signal transduction histidine kinase
VWESVQYVQRVTRLGHHARRYWLDALVLLAVAESIAELFVDADSKDAPQTTLWFDVPAIALMALPLFARRRFPFAAPAAFWLLGAALSFVDGRLVPFTIGIYLLGVVAAFLLGNVGDAVQVRIGLAVVVGSAVIIVYNLPGHSQGDLVFIPLLFAICWLAGFALRTRAEQVEAAEERAAQAERAREAAARIAVAEERTRIARELHDVVAHAVSVMVLQVGAVRHGLPDTLAADGAALEDVERTGRTALTEMRRLLGAMRRDGEGPELGPQPGLDALDSLVQEVGRAGLPVELRVEGAAAPLPPAIDLSAYRIVQEGLTNVIKHGRASKAEVVIRYAPDEVRIEVRDDGVGASAGDGSGYGLIGIRERVKIYGGDMTAGAVTGGGFVLSTRLPLAESGR